MELTTDQKGAIAESAIALTAIRAGLGVYRPIFEGGRYDLVIDTGPRLLRVQCKWAVLGADVVTVRCYSCRRTRDGQLKRGYSAAQVDAIAAYCAEIDRCFFIPMTRLRTRTRLQLRLGPARNNQRKGVNWADDFSLDGLQCAALGP